jgi:hypothetical protein
LDAVVEKQLLSFDLIQVAMFVRKLDQASLPPKTASKSDGSTKGGGDWLVTLRRSAQRVLVSKADSEGKNSSSSSTKG